VVLSKTGTIALALAALIASGVAQTPPAKKEWKSQAEYTLVVEGVGKAATPADRLAKLDEWTKQFPTTDFALERSKQYLETYQLLNKPREVMNTAAEILKTDPNDYQAIRAIIVTVFQTGNPPPAADLDAGEKAAAHLVADANTIMTPERKYPANLSDKDWTDLKPQMQAYAQKTIGQIYIMRKDNARAEQELVKALQMNPNDGGASYMLGGQILAQKANTTKPDKIMFALFEFARAANYTGPGAADDATRKAAQTFLAKQYLAFHGSNEGLDKLVATAKTNALPPGDFKVASVVEIAQQKADEEAKIMAANPGGALWKTIKDGLTGDGADAFWDSAKDHELPGGANGVTKWKAKIVSMKPATRPKEIVLGFENSTVGDITLKLEEALPGTMEPGSELEFKGTAEAYTKSPYMLTLKIDKDDLKESISGWTGKNAAPVRRPATKKQ
jgi:hypothetical protein